MTDSLEVTLARTLTAAGSTAPEPGTDFAEAVAGRRRRLRRSRSTLLAGAAVLALSVPTAVAVTAWRVDGDGGPAKAADRTARIDAARPVRDVWAAYLEKLPRTLPDGRGYLLHRQLDDDRFLVTPQSAAVAYHAPAVYSQSSNEVVSLMSDTVPPGVTDHSFGPPEVGERGISWVVRGQRNGSQFAEVWLAPLAGGAGTRQAVLTLPPTAWMATAFQAGPRLYIEVSVNPPDPAGTAAPVTRMRTAHLYQITDGAPVAVPGTEDFVWYSGAWLARHEPRPGTVGSSEPAGMRVIVDGWLVKEYWNLATGERRAPVIRPGLRNVHCGPERCYGSDGDTKVAYPWNGTGDEARLSVSGRDTLSRFTPQSERFTEPVSTADGWDGADERYLWDVRHDEVLVLDKDTTGGMPCLEFPAPEPGKKWVVDLNRVR